MLNQQERNALTPCKVWFIRDTFWSQLIHYLVLTLNMYQNKIL